MFGILKNVSSTDKSIRLGLAVLSGIGAIWAVSASAVGLAVGLGAATAVLLVTGLLNTCLLYLSFGINTRRSNIRP